MPAYVLADIEVQGAAKFEEYRTRVPASIAAYGGRYIVRGGKIEPLEGSWSPSRLVIIEFPSTAQAKSWWSSEEYAEAKALRESSCLTRLLVVEGI